MDNSGFDPEKIDHEYRRRLCALVEREMNRRHRRREDPEDVVQSVFRTFFRRASQGKYDIESTEALWGLLRHIARLKILKHVEYHEAKKRNPDRESSSDVSAVQLPRPSEAEGRLLGDVLETVLDGLEPPDMYILSLQLNGYMISEIAEIVLQGLEEPYPRILQLRLQAFTYSKIAEKLDLTPEQVRYRIDRLVERLNILLR